MPELPDLEVFKGNIFKQISSKKLTAIRVYNPNKVNLPTMALEERLKSEVLQAIDRVGKELYFVFSGGKCVTAHLMLNGTVSVLKSAADNVKFKIFAFEFENETVLFSDRGGLCTIKYVSLPSPLGAPDAFSSDFTLEYFKKIAGKKARTNIKAFLIDQSVVKGIGNAYADEILWDARISPHSVMGRDRKSVV